MSNWIVTASFVDGMGMENEDKSRWNRRPLPSSKPHQDQQVSEGMAALMAPFNEHEWKVVAATLDYALEKQDHSITGPKSFAKALRRRGARPILIDKALAMKIAEVQHLVWEYEWETHDNEPVDPEVEARRAIAVEVMVQAGFDDIDQTLQASSGANHAFHDFVANGTGSAHAIVAAACRTR